jgi:hypothetical protein
VFGCFFDRMSLEQNARWGKSLAVSSALGWGYLAGFMLSNAAEIRTQTVTLSGSSSVLATIAAIPIVLGGYYGRSLAYRDLVSRVDVETGLGKKWRWGLAVQFWGAWAYWLVADSRLPPRGTFSSAQELLVTFGPLRRARQRKADRSRETPS